MPTDGQEVLLHLPQFGLSEDFHMRVLMSVHLPLGGMEKKLLRIQTLYIPVHKINNKNKLYRDIFHLIYPTFKPFQGMMCQQQTDHYSGDITNLFRAN